MELYRFLAAALSPKGIAGIVSMEPSACPTPASDMTPFKGLPILVLFGDNTAQSPVWGPKVKACRDFVRADNAAGGKAEIILLRDVGYAGNSHMLMQDKNSLTVAEWLAGWIDAHVGQRK